MAVMKIPKGIAENREKLEDILKFQILAFAHDKNLPTHFISDSMVIQNSIKAIANRTARLIHEVKKVK